MQIKFEVNGQIELSRNLRVLTTQLPNFREFLQDACEIVGERSDAIFQKQGSNVEKAPRWAALAPSTVKARQRGWWYYKNTPSNPGILRWTGKMQQSKMIKTTDTMWTLWFKDPKAIYHQTGSSKLPQRVLIDLDNPTNTKIVKSLQGKIQRDIGIFNQQV